MVKYRARTVSDASLGSAAGLPIQDPDATKFAGCFNFGLGRQSKHTRIRSAKAPQHAAAEQQQSDRPAPVPAKHEIPLRDLFGTAPARKQPAVAHAQTDLNIFRGDSASYTERAALCNATGAAATPTPAVARPVAPLRPATPPLPDASDLSFATALDDSSLDCRSSTCSGSGDAGSGDVGSGGSGGSGSISEAAGPECPRIKAIDAFVRSRSFADADNLDDLCPLRTNSAGAPGQLSSISLDAWLRSGSGSFGRRSAAARGRSSMSLDNWLRTGSAGSAGSAELLCVRASSSGLPPRAALSLDLRRGASGRGAVRDFAARSTPRRLDAIRRSLGRRPPAKSGLGGDDARCSVDAGRRREAMATAPAPLHLFETELPHQGVGASGANLGLLPADHRYQRLLNLSSGLCTSVDLCLDTESETPVVIRFLERGPVLDEASVRRQLAFHRRAAGHPHIAQLLDVFALPEHLALVMQWANCGNLKAYITSYTQENGTGIPEKDARSVMRQLLTAVRFAHKHGCATAGIKLDDVLLHVDPENPDTITVRLLCGWAGSEEGLFSPSNMKTSGGLPDYKAPEALASPQHDTAHADGWCCGAVMYMLLAGAFPFLTAREAGLAPMRQLHALVQRIVSGRFLDLMRSVTPSCLNLLTRLLDPDPDLRITVKEALQHPWIAADPTVPKVAAASAGRRVDIPEQWVAALRSLAE